MLVRDTLFPKVLKFHLPDLCNHSLEHLKDFSSPASEISLLSEKGISNCGMR